MAAKSKKRLSKIENKILKLDKLQINDVICSICQSILTEPVTLPCFHDFCYGCFNGSVENNALCCPLCRLRIGSWLRTTRKQNNLVNVTLWEFIKTKFPEEIAVKLKGDDINVPEDKPLLRLSAPGEIRSEYEAELTRLRAERLQLEQKHLKETEDLVKKIQEEEDETHKKYLERLKQDETLAIQMQQGSSWQPNATIPKKNIESTSDSRRRINKIDNYLCKRKVAVATKDSPQITDDNTSTDCSTPRQLSEKDKSRASPEMTPSYSRHLKNGFDKKFKTVSGLWNKENGQDGAKDVSLSSDSTKKEECSEKGKQKKTVHSLPVSLPYTGKLLQKRVGKEGNNETGSVDSMRLELCYFKPIEGTSPTRSNSGPVLPLRVPGLRVRRDDCSRSDAPLCPSRSQYLESLCRLRSVSLAQNLPSAFVIALKLLLVGKEAPPRPCLKTKASLKTYSPMLTLDEPEYNEPPAAIDGITKLDTGKTLRRTRSMTNLPKADNETTPKKAKIKRKASSEKKRCLRSQRKNTKRSSNSPIEPTNNNKINLDMKKLSSPLETCDVKKILEEQLRIERLIQQEKNDLELARKMDAEWNGRQLRRNAVKRQVTLSHALRPTKKLKV